MRRYLSLAVCGLSLIFITCRLEASPTPAPRATVEQRIIALEMLRANQDLRRLNGALTQLQHTLEQVQQTYWRRVLDAPPLCPVPR
jgi:hypothetical protein